MSQAKNAPNLTIFADANVFIEALLLENSDASLVIRLASLGLFEFITCATVIKDVENVILNKAKNKPDDLEILIDRWTIILKRAQVIVRSDPDDDWIKTIYQQYISIMRHKNDIPMLASALQCRADYILSGNREHFNDAVAQKSKILICSCSEFMEIINDAWYRGL